MPVPSFQEMFVPFLQLMGDDYEHTSREVHAKMIESFSLSDEDVEDRIPSGDQTRLSNRIGWCRTHLKNAGLIVYNRAGVYQITERGKEVLNRNLESIDLKFLDTFEEHRKWFHREKRPSSPSSPKTDPASPSNETNTTTPEEQIGSALIELEDSLQSELLDQLHSIDPFRFEEIVLDLLFAMGYGGSRKEAAKITKKTNDEGIDGTINEDRLGLDVIYVQAKRWQNTIGRKEIQSFVGALAGQQANKGVFITTSDFASTATEYARAVSQKVILIDGKKLSDLMIEHDIGVSTLRTIKIKRIDSDYFLEA